MTLAIQTYNQSGIKTGNQRNSFDDGPKSDRVPDLGNQYFRKTNDFPMSPGMAAAGIEIIGAGALWRCFPGPATVVNLLTTVGETAGVLVSKIKFKDQYWKDGFLAWFQVLSGGFGFLGVAKETFFTEQKQDYENVPLFEKVTLSGASLLNVFLMLSGAIEKSLLSMVCRNRNDKHIEGDEARASLTSALSDRRCSVEWSIMTAVPWISSIGPIKKFLDVLIPYQALREGFDTFVENPDASLLGKLGRSPTFQKSIKAVINPLSLFKKDVLKDDEEKYKLCWPFTGITRFLLGTESDKGGKGASGLRNYLLKPLFELLSLGKLKTPLYYLDKDKNVVVEFQDQEQKEQVVTKGDEKQTVKEPNVNEVNQEDGKKVNTVESRLGALERKASGNKNY